MLFKVFNQSEAHIFFPILASVRSVKMRCVSCLPSRVQAGTCSELVLFTLIHSFSNCSSISEWQCSWESHSIDSRHVVCLLILFCLCWDTSLYYETNSAPAKWKSKKAGSEKKKFGGCKKFQEIISMAGQWKSLDREWW